MRLYAPVSLLQGLEHNGKRYRDVAALWLIESREYEHRPPFAEYILNYEESATEELVMSYFTEAEALRLQAWLAEFEREDLYLMRPAPLVVNGDTPPLWHNEKPVLSISDTPFYGLPFRVSAILDFSFAKIKVTEPVLDELIRRRESEIYVLKCEIENYRAMSERDYYIAPEELAEFEGLLDKDDYNPFGDNEDNESALQAWADFNANEFYRHLRTTTPCA